MGNIFGGQVLAYIDEVAGIAAMRHSGRPVVTASIDSVDFLLPVREGDIMTVDAFVVWTGRTSMEVYIQVTTEKGPGGPPQLTTTSFVTAVAVGEDGKPVPVPPVLPQTKEEQRLYEMVAERQQFRKEGASQILA